jgi:hypothetical protein
MARRRAPFDNIWLLDDDGNPVTTLKGLAPDEPSEASVGRVCSRGDSVSGGASWPRRAVAPTLRRRIAAADDATLIEPDVPELPLSEDETTEGEALQVSELRAYRYGSSTQCNIGC